MDFEQVREQFPALADKVFLDAACVSLAPLVATDAIGGFLALALKCPSRSATLHHIEMDEMRAAARPEVARLINAAPDEIAMVESTTHGLSIAASALPLERGDRVLISDLEFLEVAVPWYQLADRTGIEVDVVPNRDGRIEIEDFADHLRPRTRVVAVSSVQWSNGFRVDLNRLSEVCRSQGIFLVVDAIQQLGAIPLDVGKTRVDMLACGGHKWLNAPFGAGFLYVNRATLPKLKPPIAGYLSLEPPQGGWGEYFQTASISPAREYRFRESASRYEVGGTSNYPGAVGLAASVGLINSLGAERIGDWITQLSGRLIEGLDSIKRVEVVTHREIDHRSGIVTFSVGSSEMNVELMERLLDRRILVSVRYTSGVGGIRVSCHLFNQLAEMDLLLNCVEELVGDR